MTKPAKPEVDSINQLPSDKEILLATAAAEVKVQNKIKNIYFAWPNLQQATLKLADYMGLTLTSEDGVSLYGKCLKEAVDRYESCQPEEISTAAQMYAYLDGLLFFTPEIVALRLATKKKPQKFWEPFDTSIFEFTKDRECEIIRHPYCEMSPESIRLMILARIINIKDLRWMEEGSTITNFFSGLSRDGSLAAH